MIRTANLHKAIFLLVIFSFMPQAQGQGDTSDPFEIKIKQVAVGIYLAYRPDATRIPVEGNVTIIINESDVIVVDGSGAPLASRRVIAEIKKLTSLPVSYLINTHGHGDHVAGNQEYVKAFPGVEIVSHPGTRAYIAGGGMNYVKEIAESAESRKLEGETEIKRIRDSKRPGAEEVIAYLQRYYQGDLKKRSAAYREVVVTPPTMTFDKSFILHRGQRVIELLHLGFGKSGSDVVVYLPREKIVVAGDILTHPIPYGFSRKPSEWLSTMEKLAELEFDYLIPGHGEIQTDKSYLRSVIGLAQAVLVQVRKAVNDGANQTQTLERVNLSDFERQFSGQDPVLGYLFQVWFSAPIIERAFKEISQEKARANSRDDKP